MMNKGPNIVLALVKTFAMLIAAYLTLGLAAWLVPDAPVHRHVCQTLERGDLREQYPPGIITRGRCRLDNYTDALIVNQALMLRTGGISGMLLLPRRYDDTVQTHNLALAAAEAPDAVITHYARYWCGSVYITRLLFCVTDFIGVRYLLYIASSLLLLWLVLAMWKRGWRLPLLAVVYSLLMVNLFVMQLSMQFAPVLFIAVGAMLWLCYHPGVDRRSLALLFMVVGSLTAFLDMITVPTLTLGLPLAVLVWQRAEGHIGKGVRSIFSLAIVWLLGYTFTWASKWGLATWLTGEDVFASAYGQARMWSDDGEAWLLRAVVTNVAHLRKWYILMPMAILLLLALVCHKRAGRPVAVQLAIVAAIPLVYYLLMPHPAAWHNWYNYRALATMLAAAFLAVAAMVDWPRLCHTLSHHRTKYSHDSRGTAKKGD